MAPSGTRGGLCNRRNDTVTPIALKAEARRNARSGKETEASLLQWHVSFNFARKKRVQPIGAQPVPRPKSA